ncbi:hypothetical protein BJY04DRAFT_217827 [Aspergillus karnatakaensis]|uniref:BTB/POZ domain-containing protein n=1 Tax=Aspergillus karnatakaensis TaxID=1810916 RepID=UPI003CCD2825
MTTHIITPEGEVTIILREPNAPFAPLPPESVKVPALAASNTPTTIITLPSSTTEQHSTGKDSSDTDVHFCVSAAHLIHASPVFKKVLSGGWKESVTFKETGTVEIEAHGWDTNAFTILMHILHCQPQKLPKQGDLELAAKVTVLADYYDCADTVRYYIDPWIPRPLDTLLEDGRRGALIGLWVAWALRRPTSFTKCSSLLMSSATRCITALGLPLPQKIIEKLNQGRDNALRDTMYAIFEKRLDLTLNDRCTVTCRSMTCRSIMLGALLIHLRNNNINLLRLGPHNDISLKGLVTSVKSIRIAQWREYVNSDGPFTWHKCAQSDFTKIFNGLTYQVAGLELKDFKW